ncbi:MAG: ABC transporter ATP-binding protein [Bryobacteraceae bacterium]|nr:ABC transporter ATP-binding protein [Bryobacteraceae bacterium]
MVELTGVTKEYATAAGPLRILDGVDLTLQAGDAAVIMGPSGSGKSTLLYILGALDNPTSGTVRVNGVEPSGAAFRNKTVGFVFQDHALLPQCTVLENVLIPTLVAGGDHTARARMLVEAVGLGTRMDHKPAQLSGGERQRAAIARALILKPALLLCDEPTGNLDRDSADKVAELLLRLHREEGSVLVVVTHSAELAARFPIRLELRDKKLVRA